MKKFLILVLIVALAVAGCFTLVACDSNTIIVQTNAYFAPFEYFDANNNVVGVDVDIMNLVGEKLNKKVKFVHIDEFSAIVTNVSAGKICDVGAAGITITPERSKQVDFSIPYYTAVQYVIAKTGTVEVSKSTEGQDVVMWSALAGKEIGVQRDTTGDFAVQDAVDEGGVLYGTNANLDQYDSAILATDAVGAGLKDCVVVDELPAKNIVAKKTGYVCYPLYNSDGEPTTEEYAMCVPKGDTKYLNAINEVLESLLVKGDDGKSEMDKLVEKHFFGE